jgi:RNA polymerase sigma factor (sigma-70 family)
MSEVLDETQVAAKSRADTIIEENRRALEKLAWAHHARDVDACIGTARRALMKCLVEQGDANDGHLRALAKKAARGAAIDQVRAASRKLRTERALAREPAPELHRTVLTPEEEVSRAELRVRVRNALATLSPEEIEVVPHIIDGGGYKDLTEPERNRFKRLVNSVTKTLGFRLEETRKEFAPYLGRARKRGGKAGAFVLAWLAARKRAIAAALNGRRFALAVLAGGVVAATVSLLLFRGGCGGGRSLNGVASRIRYPSVATSASRRSEGTVPTPSSTGVASSGARSGAPQVSSPRSSLHSNDPRSTRSSAFVTEDVAEEHCVELAPARYGSMADVVHACLRSATSMKTTVPRIGARAAGMVPSHIIYEECETPRSGRWNCASASGFLDFDDLTSGAMGRPGYTNGHDVTKWAVPMYIDAGIVCARETPGRSTAFVFNSESIRIDDGGTKVLSQISAARWDSTLDTSPRFGFSDGEDRLELNPLTLAGRVQAYEPFDAPIRAPVQTVMFGVQVQTQSSVRFILQDSIALVASAGSLDIVRFNPVAIDRQDFMANLGNSRSAIVSIDDSGRCTLSRPTRDDIPANR